LNFRIIAFSEFWVRIQLFKFVKFWDIFGKSFENYQKLSIFIGNFFWIICFESTRKTLKNFSATLTFRVGDHIFFICSLKNHMTFFWDFWSKIFKKFSHFLFKNFLTYFSGITGWNYEECLFFFKYVLVLFLRTCSYSKS
jgi:hypothetical protein